MRTPGDAHELVRAGWWEGVIQGGSLAATGPVWPAVIGGRGGDEGGVAPALVDRTRVSTGSKTIYHPGGEGHVSVQGIVPGMAISN